MMKHALPTCLLALGITPVSAQLNRPLTLEEFLAAYPELLKQSPALPHTNVVRGLDNPAAVPLHIPTLMMLYGEFGREINGMRPAVDRFADRYAVDGELAAAMVTAIREVQSELEANTLAQRQTFCARSFSSNSSWKAAAIALDADSASAQVAAFNKLRDLAGPELWEKIVLEASARARSVVIVQEDYDSIAAELGYETAFANQCNPSRERNQ
jgi:hypothetical protein